MINDDLAMSRPLPPSLPHKFKLSSALKYLDTSLRNFRGISSGMLRRLCVVVQRPSLVGNVRNYLFCSATQKLYYHPTLACWREVELDKNPFYDKYKEKLQHVVR